MLQRWIERSNTVQKNVKKDMNSLCFATIQTKTGTQKQLFDTLISNIKCSFNLLCIMSLHETPLQEIVCASNVQCPRNRGLPGAHNLPQQPFLTTTAESEPYNKAATTQNTS